MPHRRAAKAVLAFPFYYRHTGAGAGGNKSAVRLESCVSLCGAPRERLRPGECGLSSAAAYAMTELLQTRHEPQPLELELGLGLGPLNRPPLAGLALLWLLRLSAPPLVGPTLARLAGLLRRGLGQDAFRKQHFKAPFLQRRLSHRGKTAIMTCSDQINACCSSERWAPAQACLSALRFVKERPVATGETSGNAYCSNQRPKERRPAARGSGSWSRAHGTQYASCAS